MLFNFFSAFRVSYMQAAHDRDKNKYLLGFKRKPSRYGTCDCRSIRRRRGHQPINMPQLQLWEESCGKAHAILHEKFGLFRPTVFKTLSNDHFQPYHYPQKTHLTVLSSTL